MTPYPVTYNMTLTLEVQADSAEEAERLADRELPSHCDVDRVVVCHRIATSAARPRPSGRPHPTLSQRGGAQQGRCRRIRGVGDGRGGVALRRGGCA